MDAAYDELISENPFYIELKNKYNSLYQHCVTESWVICVPRIASLHDRAFTIDDFCSHILVPDEELPETRYSTLTEKQVTVINKVITVEISSSLPLQSHVLFEETFYTEDFIKFRVWCVESPLDPACTARSNALISLDQLITVNDCVELLWMQSTGRHVVEQIEQSTKDFIHKNKTLPVSLTQLNDLVGELYTKCSQISLQNKRLREKSKYCKQTMDAIKLAIESYTQHCIYDSVFKAICTCCAYEDSRLNKIIRNLSDIQLRDLNIRKELYEKVPKAKQILSKLCSYTTILEKVLCLKQALNTMNKISVDEPKPVLLTADDLLPVFVFLVIKTGLPNWYSQLVYMKEFRFNSRAKCVADETAFLVTTLEAVMEHILSGALVGCPHPESYYNENCQYYETHSKSNHIQDDTIEKLFQLIKKSQYDEVKEMLERNKKIIDSISDQIDFVVESNEEIDIFNENVDVKELCHPLCNCHNCCKQISKKVLLTSPTVSSRDNHGLTALHVASIHGQADIVELLITMQANIEDTDLNECTALHYAASRGQQSALLFLLHAGAIINKQNLDQNTPLHLASNNGHLNCVKALIYFAENNQSNLNINCTNEHGDTPLHFASKWGYEGITKILVESGGEPSLQNKKNKSAFDYAHNSRILNILQSSIPNLYDFIHITNTNVGNVRTEASRTKDNVQSSFENMKRIDRVFKAISFGDVKLACFFMNIKYTVSVTNVPSNGILCHPLCECEFCKAEEKPPTCDNEFDVNISDSVGNTALHLACQYGLKELCEILLQHCANINLANKNGQTALHFAALYNKPAQIQWLIENKANINAVNITGDTPLHDATDMGNIGAIKILLNNNPNLGIKNCYDKTALDIAKDKVFLTIIDLIQKHENMLKI